MTCTSAIDIDHCAAGSAPLRCLSVDVEEYFHIEAAYGTVGRRQWDDWPSRVERNIDLLLEMFDRRQCRATFFILGHLAQRRGQAIKRIAEAGHEIACHSNNHDRLHRLDPQSFREDLLHCKNLLEDQTSGPVVGYRAPSFSLVRRTAWAIDVLIDAGFEYDASIFPVRHPHYGVPSAPVGPFMVCNGNGAALLEVPPLVWRVLARNLAVAGGGYFRLLPVRFMLAGLSQAARRRRPAVLYFHPWEFDPHMPRMGLPILQRVRTYTGLKRSAVKLEKIISLPGRWSAIADVLDELRRMAEARPVYDLAGSRT